MHALRYLLAFLLIVGSLVIAYLLLRPSYSPHSVPQPAQPVRLRPRLNASSADSLPPIASSAGVDPYDPITITDQAHRINTNPLPDVSELDNLVVADCLVPRYAPYATVVQITNHSISVKINDPNDAKQTPAIAYKVYYWGHKLSPKGKPLTNELDYGKQTLTKDESHHLYVIEGLKSGFSYCADLTALSDCGHGPICSSCFENVIIL